MNGIHPEKYSQIRQIYMEKVPKNEMGIKGEPKKTQPSTLISLKRKRV